MARELAFIHAEILRVAAELGVDPRRLTRDAFITRSEVTVHDLYCGGTFAKLKRDAANQGDIAPEYDATQKRGVELRNLYAARLEREAGSTKYLLDRLESMLVDVFERVPINVTATKKSKLDISKTSIERELVAVMSDPHYGLAVDRREVPANSYTWTVAARRTARFVEQIAGWKPEHRDETELTVCILGDLVHGGIHLLSEGTLTLLTEQVEGAISILVQAIDELREHFRSIRIIGVSGNHDRFPHRGGRSVSCKWDSLASMVFFGLRCAFRSAHDVKFDFPRTPYATFELPGGHLAYGTHGDTVTTTGNLGRSINVERIARQVYELDASGVLPKPISVAICGHVHVPAYTVLSNGCSLIVNGTLSGTDSYAQSIGFHGNHPSQTIFEAVPSHPVGDFRIISLREADAVERYDEIISHRAGDGVVI